MEKTIVNALDAVSTHNVLKGYNYSFDRICDYLISKGEHKGYDRASNLCVIYFSRYAVVITLSGIERLKRA